MSDAPRPAPMTWRTTDEPERRLADILADVTRQIAGKRAEAIDRLVTRAREAAWAHCAATGDRRAKFPMLATNGVSALAGVEQIELRCGVCETPIDGLHFRVQVATVTRTDPATCAHGRGRTVRCRRCEREGLR